MKKLLIISFVILFTSCTNREVSQERKDSLEAAAAADSLLKEAEKNDTTTADKVAVDTSETH